MAKNVWDASLDGDADRVGTLVVGDRSLLNAWGVAGWTPLHYACQRGSKKCAQVLLRGGCKVDATDSSGWTPLMEAAWNGHHPLVDLLIKRVR